MVPEGIPEVRYIVYLEIMSWAGRREGVYAERFSEALLTAAAAERVALKSSILRDSGAWYEPLGDHPESRATGTPWPDSQLDQREQLVRAQIALFH
jgi:hypothetical protein